jgi:hypothetical protein
VFLIHKNEFLLGIGVKLINAIPLFSLTKPINYPFPLELILKGHDNTFFRQRLKKKSGYFEETAESYDANKSRCCASVQSPS